MYYQRRYFSGSNEYGIARSADSSPGRPRCPRRDAGSWGWRELGARPALARSLAEHIVDLHEDWHPLSAGNHWVSVDGVNHELWQGPQKKLVPVIGGGQAGNSPYTLWRLGAFEAGKRYVVRLELTMNDATYDEQIGSGEEVFAHGDEWLLRMIRQTDIPNSSPADAERYTKELGPFRTTTIPSQFEWLLVSRPDSPVYW